MSRIGFQKSMKLAPEVAVKLLWNLSISLSRRYMEQLARLQTTAALLQKTVASVQQEDQETVAAATEAVVAAPRENPSISEQLSVLSAHVAESSHLATADATPWGGGGQSPRRAKWEEVQERGFASLGLQGSLRRAVGVVTTANAMQKHSSAPSAVESSPTSSTETENTSY